MAPTDSKLFDALKYTVVADSLGNTYYYNGAGQLHREDGPAIVFATGHELWMHNGVVVPEPCKRIHIKN
jgi:hypothetical protein